MTKQEVVTKVKDLEEDNKALWHIVQCLEEEIDKLQKKVEEVRYD